MASWKNLSEVLFFDKSESTTSISQLSATAYFKMQTAWHKHSPLVTIQTLHNNPSNRGARKRVAVLCQIRNIPESLPLYILNLFLAVVCNVLSHEPLRKMLLQVSRYDNDKEIDNNRNIDNDNSSYAKRGRYQGCKFNYGIKSGPRSYVDEGRQR